MANEKPSIGAVYIISNPGRSIRVGATQDLECRVFEHKPPWLGLSYELFGWSSSRFKAGPV